MPFWKEGGARLNLTLRAALSSPVTIRLGLPNSLLIEVS